MNPSSSADVDAVVNSDGTVVVPPAAIRELALVPGQRVRVRLSPARQRRNMYGALVGKIHDVSAEEIADERRAIWDELAEG